MYIRSLNLTADVNGDGSYSLWEFWDLLRQIVRVPGNLFVEGLGHVPYLADWLDIQASAATGYESLNGLLALVISLTFWVITLFAILTLSSPSVDEPMPQRNVRRWGAPNPPLARTATHHTFMPVSRPAYAAHGTVHKRRRPHGMPETGRHGR